jgi:hypothetical protein
MEQTAPGLHLIRDRRQGHAMTDAHAIARKTAKRLAPQFGGALPLAVEKVIHGADGKAEQFGLEALAALAGIAAFILQCVQAVIDWKRKNKDKADIEDLKRVLLELRPPQGVSEKARDEVIDAVVEEVKDEG